MYQQTNPNEMPGIGTSVIAAYKPIWKGRSGVQYLPGGGTIDGANARDPLNTYSGGIVPNAQASYANVLQPGLLMGKITASGFYGASVLGLSLAAYVDNDTTITVSAATATEVIRRLGGTTGSLKFIGPPTAGGTVAATAITVTAVTVNGNSSTITCGDLNLGKVAGSIIAPADGSETIKTFVDEEDGIRVTDGNGNNLAIQFPRIPIGGGVVYTANIVNYPSDSALKSWIKTALKAVGPFLFDDDL